MEGWLEAAGKGKLIVKLSCFWVCIAEHGGEDGIDMPGWE